MEAKTVATPGELLRSARQLYGWSVEEVADELNLLPYIIQALENDDYDQLAGWTYVVGYLRSYGKLVSVNVESAIKQHEKFLPPTQDGPGTVTENIVHRQPIAIHYRWVVTVVVLIVVVGGLYGAYLKRSGDVERIDLASNELNNELAKIQKEPVPVNMQSKNINKADSVLNNDSTLVASTSRVTEKEKSSGIKQVSGSTVTNEKKLSDPESTAGSGADESHETVADDSVTMNNVQTRSQVPTSKQMSVRPATTDLTQGVVVKKKASQKQVLQTNVTPERSAINPVADALVQTGFVAEVQLPRAESTPTRTGVSSTLEAPVDKVKAKQSKVLTSQEPGSSGVVTQSKRTITIALKRGSQVIVYDGKGVELLRRYFPPGKVVTISGKPPFDVRLRVSEGAQVLYNGKAIKVPVPGNGGRIRFQVGIKQIGGKDTVIANQGRGE
jgi:cytoskeleton protein RodZ